MGIRRSLLIAFAALLFCQAPPVALAADPGCLRCHPAHYEEKGRCSHCHKGNESGRRAAIAHLGLYPARYSYFRMEESTAVRRGGELLGNFGCRRCHVSGEKGNRLSSDLDTLPFRSSPERIAEAIRVPAYYMPDFRFGEEQIAELVNAILAASGKKGKGAGETPVQVHFKKDGEEDVFSRRCGPCHKALAAGYGGLGKGNIGPNLSALFSAEYPKPDRKGKTWSPERLRAWIANPRKERPTARMPPVRLKDGEFLLVVERLEVPPDRGIGK